MSENQAPLILLSTGGTGGHMTPARALANDLLSRGYRVEVITDERGKKYQNMFEGISMHEVRSGTLGSGMMGKAKGHDESGARDHAGLKSGQAP